MIHQQGDPGADPIVVEGHYTVSPEQVFNAWTDPEQVKKWFGSQAGDLHEATIDLRPGGKWRFVEHEDRAGSAGFEGEYVEVVPNERLVFTWAKVSTDHNDRRVTSPISRVEIWFDGTDDATHMRIVHSNLDAETHGQFQTGWSIGAANLAKHLRP